MEFCARCGKVGKTTDGLCSKCFNLDKKLPLKDIKVKICLQTHRYLYKNKWRDYSTLNDIFKKLLQEQIKQPFTVSVSLPKHEPKPDTKVTAELTLKLKNNEYIIPTKIQYTISQLENKHKGYFEAILQIRNPIEDVYKEIEQSIARRNDVFVAKVIESKHGNDYYLSSNQYAQALGKSLQRQFGGELKVTSKLFSRDKMTSKNLYRLTILLRLPKVSIGDIVTIGSDDFKILEFGNKVRIQDIKSGKKSYCNYADL